MARLLAALLCGTLGLALWPRGPAVALTLPDPPRTLPAPADPALQPFLASMTADDLVRGLWAKPDVDPALRAKVGEALVTRRKVETLREARRQARAAWLADSVPMVEACR